MSGLELVIGNKNYSSWSLRPWIMETSPNIDANPAGLRYSGSCGAVRDRLRDMAHLRQCRTHSLNG